MNQDILFRFYEEAGCRKPDLETSLFGQELLAIMDHIAIESATKLYGIFIWDVEWRLFRFTDRDIKTSHHI